MFERKTVFLIGAGASTHFGYPTNNKLLELVQKQAKKFISFNKMRFADNPKPTILDQLVDDKNQISDQNYYWKNFKNKCEELVSKINFQKPIIIDDFLRDHPELQILGKTLIAYIIGKIERDKFSRSDFHFDENWVSLIVNIMANECKDPSDILKNDVHFITFNYDLSLERNLIKNINSKSKFSNVDLREFIANRVIHIYGSISDDPFSRPLPYWLSEGEIARHQQLEFCEDLNMAYLSSKNLRLINSDEKVQNEEQIGKAKSILSKFEDLYILGYGFDPSNNSRLGLRNNFSNGIGKPRSRRVYLTTHGKNSTVVSRRACIAIFGFERELLDSLRFSYGDSTGHIYAERSEKNAFEALEFDFI